MKIKIESCSEENTISLGIKIASLLFKESLILLTGDLGAGKTTFTKGIAKGLNIKDEVNSPTFNILKCYFNKPLNLYHIDAYRLEGVNKENKNIGLEEVIEGDGVCVIEWRTTLFLLKQPKKINLKNLGKELKALAGPIAKVLKIKDPSQLNNSKSFVK